jgi:hypothetical protein
VTPHAQPLPDIDLDQMEREVYEAAWAVRILMLSGAEMQLLI